jgi:hypothetical protein
MIGNWQALSLSVPRRYMEYADAYLAASADVSRRMSERAEKRTWPNACVAMLLAAHSVELFLKAFILTRSPGEALGHHRLADLDKSYRALFPESSFQLEIPFRTEYLGMTDAEVEMLNKDEPVPSILFRYPVRKPCVEWEGLHAFEPRQFLLILEQVEKDYARIVAQLGDI